MGTDVATVIQARREGVVVEAMETVVCVCLAIVSVSCGVFYRHACSWSSKRLQ